MTPPMDCSARPTICSRPPAAPSAAINQLAGTIAQINSQHSVGPSGGVDAGVDAQLNASLDQLSQYVNFTVLQQPDGQISVYLGGQTPLVLGEQSYAIQGDFSTPQTAILSSSGTDITDQLAGGQLGAELNDNNNLLPSYVSGLNTLAQTLADQVNNGLNNGIDENGAAPITNLFYVQRHHRREPHSGRESAHARSDCRRIAGRTRW